VPRRDRPRRERTGVALTLAIVMAAAFVQLVDVSIVNVAIPSIQRDLHASSAAIQLVVAGYLLAFAVTLVTGARLGDIYGRRRLFVIGMIGFTAASAACGAAPDAVALVLARVVQGAFSALMYPQVLSVIQVSVPPERRGRAFGVLGAVIGSALVLGPVVGGLLISADIGGWSWRSIFYVNVPLGAIAVVGALARLPESRAPDAPTLDVPGAVLGAGAVFLFVYPLVQGRQDGWPVWGWAMLGGAAVVSVAFAVHERRRSEAGGHPIVHTSLVHDRAFVRGSLLVLVFFAGLPALVFALTQYLQLGYGFGALAAGLTVLPYAAGELVSSIFSNRVAARLGVRVLTLGVILAMVGVAGVLLVVHAVGTRLDAVELIGVLLVGGGGLGLFIPPVTNLVLAGTRSEAAGAASGVLATVQQIGGALGVALVGIVLYGVLSSYAPTAVRIETLRLPAEMAAAGVAPGAGSAGAGSAAVAGLRSCVVGAVRPGAPVAPPSACEEEALDRGTSMSPPGRRAVETDVDGAIGRARALDFRQAFEWALAYELAVFAVAGLLTLTLPRDDMTTPAGTRPRPSASPFRPGLRGDGRSGTPGGTRAWAAPPRWRGWPRRSGSPCARCPARRNRRR
jgi:EmrB/QacA subfamily drug resistance transporter